MSTSAAKTTRRKGEVRAPTLLQDQLCFAIYSASHAFSRRYKPLLRRLDLTYPQYLCMLVLWEGDNVTVGAVGARLHLDSGTLTPLLKRLEQAGLVQRIRDHHDERQVRIVLTGAGDAMRHEVAAIAEEVRCATGSPTRDLEHLRDQLLDMRDCLNQSGE